MRKIRKAVIPAAGYGSRFLPISKAVPKEMVPVVDKPVIQHVVEEAVASGITDILIVIGRSKRAIEEHFAPNAELEEELAAKDKTEALEACRVTTGLARIHFVWQHAMRGLGDAVLHAREHVGDEPFALLMGDTIVESADGATTVTRQLCDIAEERGGSVIALEEVPLERVSRYGIMSGPEVTPDVIRAESLVEKPRPEETQSRLAVSGRYVLSSAVFPLLETTPPGKNNELQLTDALAALIKMEEVYGFKYGGRRHDVGDKLGFLKTNILFGLRDPLLADAIRAMLREGG